MRALSPAQIEHLSKVGTNLAATDRRESLNTARIPATEASGAVEQVPISGSAEQSPTAVPLSSRSQPLSPAEVHAEGNNSTIAAETFADEHDGLLPALADPAMADELISVHFDQVDIRTMLKTIGDITGINFVVDDRVKGTVTVMSPTKIRLGDIYEVLESVLEVKGYAAVPAGNLVKIIPKADAAKSNLQVRVGSDPSWIPQRDSIVTQIIPLKYADAAEVGRIIRPLLADGAHMDTYPKTNCILMTDTSANIHHVARIIQKLDVTGSREQVTIIPLKYASAEILSEQITQILEKSRTPQPQVGRLREIQQIETRLKIMPDTRTNSLVVVADAKDTEIVNRLAEQLDIQRPRGTNNVHVVYLKNAPAKETAEPLTAAVANLGTAGALEAGQQVQVTADEGTNALIITASQQDFEVLSEIIEKLDIVREQVAVEALIVEVSEESLREIGIDWATLDQAVSGTVRGFGATNFGPRVDFLSGDLEGLAVGAWKLNNGDLAIGPILHALSKVSGVNILSTPHITTSNHQKARIIVADNRAFLKDSRITETDPSTPTVIKTFEYRDVGIRLEITPHLSQGGLVRLEIDTELSKVVETATAPSPDAPTTAKRQAQTVVSMNSGSTVVIAGLIRDDKVTIEKKIPLVGDIPIVGGLFKLNRDQVQKTNLLIFITPHILGNQEDLDNMTEQRREQIEPLLPNSTKSLGPGSAAGDASEGEETGQ